MTDNQLGELEEVASRITERRARVEEAVRTGDTSSLRSARDFGWYSVELARGGRWDEAEAAAVSIKDDAGERSEALAAIAQAQARDGLTERAAGLVARIPNDPVLVDALQEKVVSLVVLARSFARQEKWRDADDVVAEAFRALETLSGNGSPWLEPAVFLEAGRTMRRRAMTREAREKLLRAADLADGVSGDMDCLKLLGEIGAELAVVGDVAAADRILRGLPEGPVREQLDARIRAHRKE